MASLTTNRFKELLALKVVDFQNDTFKIILMEPGFSFSRSTHMGYADVSAFELPTAGGYVAGGATLAGVSVTRSDILNAAIIAWTNPSWLASADIEASGAIIYDDTVAAPTANPVIGFIDFNGSVITYNGGTFTIANPTVAIQ